jgi:uncharacterized protein YjbI with pentapeptide repeats
MVHAVKGGWPIQLEALSLVASGAAVHRRGRKASVAIVVKATFGMIHERTARLIAPLELVHYDRVRPTGCLDEATELAPYLPGAGVLLSGAAHAPGNQRTTAMSVRLGIYREVPLINKVLHVIGDRTREAPAVAKPFEVMPLVYERAFGGPRTPDNPVGTGEMPGSQLPNVVDPRDYSRPAGFGPVAPHWGPRKGLLGGLPAPNDTELREGLDWRWFHAAPVDQQIEHLEGDEWIVLDGLHPTMPSFRTQLPNACAYAIFTLSGPTGPSPPKAIDLYCDTLVIKPETGVCSLLWRGHVSLDPADVPRMRATVALALAGVDLPKSFREALDQAPATVTLHEAVLPRAAVQPATATTVPTPAAPRLLADLLDLPIGKGTIDVVHVGPTSGLPFLPGVAAMPAFEALLNEPIATGTISAVRTIPVRALPFEGAEGVASAAPAALPSKPVLEDLLGAPIGSGTLSVVRASPVSSLPFTTEAAASAPASAPASKPAPLLEDLLAVPLSTGTMTAVRSVPVHRLPFLPAASPPAPPPPAPEPPAQEPPPRPTAPVASREEASAATVPVDQLPEQTLRDTIVARLARGAAIDDLPLAGADLSDLDLSDVALAAADLSKAKLARSKLTGARLAGAKLVEADLSDADLSDADLANANLARATVAGARFDGATLTGASFAGATGPSASFLKASAASAVFARGSWDQAVFADADATSADFTGASVAGASFTRAILSKARFDEARGVGAMFDGAGLGQARAVGANFGRAQFRTIDAPSSVWERATLDGASLAGANLRGANLSRASCVAASFSRAELSRANLQRIVADRADFHEARLPAVDVRQAQLADASFEGALLRDMSGGKADMSRARFAGANLEGAMLRSARLVGASFVNANLENADLQEADLDGANVFGATRATAKVGAGAKGLVEIDPAASSGR